MIQRLIIACVFLFLVLDTQAQSIELFDATGQLSAGDTIHLDVSIEDYYISVPIGITNVSASSHPINVTRYEVDVLPNTSSYFCWGSCTGVITSGFAPVYTPSGSVAIGAGITIPADDNGFVFHYDPNFQAGTSLFRLKFFDVNNPSDSADMYVSIRSMDYSAAEALETEDYLLYPNPVKQFLNVAKLDEELKLLNAQGQVLIEITSSSTDLSFLAPGTYFLRSSKRCWKIIKE